METESDSVLKLRWLETSLESGISFLRAKIERYREWDLSEWDTSSTLIEPVLRGLGWDTLDNEQVFRESRRGWQVGDIHLLLGAGVSEPKIAAVMEVKGLRHRLQDTLDQLRRDVSERLLRPNDDYNFRLRLCSGNSVFLRGVVTNGQCWSVYDFSTANAETEPTGPHLVPLCEVDVCSADRKGVGSLVNQLGQKALREKVKDFLGESKLPRDQGRQGSTLCRF